ncbi:hypothetical protein [Halobacillus amylolyticus]|uniref:Uncharacterized protein n=1 Tax=Halobacillus amylolyticus TaxID=2932259 RepID=A0ABY4HDY5_9BACI|nr:hypothetical protein [Halobacillus amylolyticus]UOR12844.1 hypothetical protein MUO15_04855 [Halobacillus amylolyticus]
MLKKGDEFVDKVLAVSSGDANFNGENISGAVTDLVVSGIHLQDKNYSYTIKQVNAYKESILGGWNSKLLIHIKTHGKDGKMEKEHKALFFIS